MNTHTKHTLTVLLLILFGGLIGVACGDPEPILIYVTPTPVIPTSAPVIASDTLVNAVPPPQTTALPTVQPGGQFGPITGSDYTVPVPDFTPLAVNLHVPPCPAIVTAAEAALYDRADPGGQVVGTAANQQSLPVREIATGPDGSQWVRTDGGWLPVNTGQAVLGATRECEILTGVQPRTTPLGLHIINWTSEAQILNFVQQLANIGRPMGIAKGLTGSEGILTRIEEISPETVTVFRSILHGYGMLDCPNFRHDPVEEAQWWLDGLERHWAEVDADYYELFNECGADSMDWIAQFSVEAMRLANEQGRCLLLLSFPAGSPEPKDMNDLLPVYEYALAHPCQPGRMHGIALHAYSAYAEGRISDKDVFIAFRHRVLYDYLREKRPAVLEVPVFYTELGQGFGFEIDSCEDITLDMLQYTNHLEQDPYVKGFAVWNVGGGEGIPWVDITDCLPLMADALVQYYTGG